MHVICLKLNTGEDLIAKAKESSSLIGGAQSLDDVIAQTPVPMFDGYIVLEDTRIISIQPTGGGGAALALLPWLLANHDGVVTVNPAKIASVIYKPHLELEKIYSQQTSPIVQASSLPGTGVLKVPGQK